MSGYVSTVVPPGYERYLVRMGAIPLYIVDKPRTETLSATEIARRWLTGDVLPDSVRVWPCVGTA